MISILVNGKKVAVNGESKGGFQTTTVDNKKGKLVFKGLKAGTYTLTETKSPSGYSLAKNPITIVITANADGSFAPSKPSASADLSPFLVRSIPYVYTFFLLGVASVVSPGLFWYVILALFSFIYTAFSLTCA